VRCAPSLGMDAHDFGRKHWEPVAVHHGNSFISLTLAACRW